MVTELALFMKNKPIEKQNATFKSHMDGKADKITRKGAAFHLGLLNLLNSVKNEYVRTYQKLDLNIEDKLQLLQAVMNGTYPPPKIGSSDENDEIGNEGEEIPKITGKMGEQVREKGVCDNANF